MKTLFSSLLAFALMISPSFAQMGPAGPPGGGITGSATFVQGGSSPTSVGGGVSVLINATQPNLDPIVAVYYKVTGGAYDNQIISYNMSSCTNYTHTEKLNYLPFPQGWSGCGWYWDENPGAKSVLIKVFLQSGAVVEKNYDYTVDKPTITSFTLEGQADQFTVTQNNELLIGDWNDGGVTINATVNANSSGGEIGFIQLAQPFNYVKHKSNYWYKTDASIYLLDYLLPGPSYWYNSPLGIVSQSNNNNISMVDYPNLRTPIDLNNYAKVMQMTNNFKTYVVFRPSGGILVGIGKMEWNQTLLATYNGPVNPTQEQYLNINNWINTFNHPNGWSQNGTIASFPIQWEKSRGQLEDYFSEGQD